VVVKAHPGHPRLSRRTAQIVAGALKTAGLPRDVLQLVEGEQAGMDAPRDPRPAVASFTGSVGGGRALARIAAERERPIPFYGELGSVSGSAGQLCTEPGFLLLREGHGLATPTIVSVALATLQEHADPLLDEAFGPLCVVVRVPPDARLADIAVGLFPGVLTAGLHLGSDERPDERPEVHVPRRRLRVVEVGLPGRGLSAHRTRTVHR
jgi:NADP-dependent aldehyde dehydrogenase